MKDLGKLKYFLGIETLRGPDGICLSLSTYALDIIFEAGLLGAKPSAIQLKLITNLLLSKVQQSEKYHCLISRLTYLTITRSDLNYIVYILS